MDLDDELARCGIEPPAPRRYRRDPWVHMRRDRPGVQLVRLIDVELEYQTFREIRPGECLMDGMTIAYPPKPGRTPEEWYALIAHFDELWHIEQEAALCTTA